MGIFINLSNHPINKWSDKQFNAASKYGNVYEIPFPVIDPSGDEKYISDLTDNYLQEIKSYSHLGETTVHIMGEMTFTYSLVQKLKTDNITCLASTSCRNVKELPNGIKETIFTFERFRKY